MQMGVVNPMSTHFYTAPYRHLPPTPEEKNFQFRRICKVSHKIKQLILNENVQNQNIFSGIIGKEQCRCNTLKYSLVYFSCERQYLWYSCQRCQCTGSDGDRQEVHQYTHIFIQTERAAFSSDTDLQIWSLLKVALFYLSHALKLVWSSETGSTLQTVKQQCVCWQCSVVQQIQKCTHVYYQFVIAGSLKIQVYKTSLEFKLGGGNF